MAKVYVVNNSGHDFSAAEKFGELVMLTEGNVNIFATDRVRAEMEEKMKDMTAEDYILLSGYSLINVLATFIALRKHLEYVNVLVFNFKTKEYAVRQI